MGSSNCIYLSDNSDFWTYLNVTRFCDSYHIQLGLNFSNLQWFESSLEYNDFAIKLLI